MTRNQRNKTLDLAAAALALSLLLPHSAAAQRHYVSGKTTAVHQKAPAAPQKTGPCADPSQCIAVDFDKAPLSEVVYLVSEITGEGFVFDDGAKTPFVSWSQQNVQKSQLLPTFIKVLTSLGLTVHRIEDSNFFAIRPDPALVSGADQLSSGVYHLKYLDADAVQKSADTIYGKRLSSFGAKGSKVIAFSGDPGLVADFSRTLADIDQPPQTDSGIASIKLRHISVRTAVAALNDLKIFTKSSSSSSAKGEKSSSSSQPSGGIFPDYWNRSVIVSGTKNQQDMALLALSAIDKPQEGHADEVVFLNVLTADDALTALKELYEALSVRKLSDERLLISGDRPLVDKALSTVSKMDGAGLQVKVEAVFASLTDKEFLELGTSLSSTRSDLSTSLNSSFVKVFPSPYSGALLNYFDEVLSVKFAAGEGFSKGEVISSPTLTVLNGKEAQLVVGQNVPFLTQKEKKSSKKDEDEENSALSVERKDVGLSFKIKPVIRPDGDFISLTVGQELSSVNPESQLKNAVDLIVDKKSVSTTVLVGNGDLIFLGGLRYQEAGKSVETVPLLGEIPILGQLFTYRSEMTHARNLIISLRVNVVSAPEQGMQGGVTFSPEKG